MPSAAPTPASPAPVSSALSAFLRGIERRAFVFVQVQCGRDEVALAALGRAMRAFREVSGHSPLSAWPAAFWALLVAQAELAEGESDIPELGALSSGPRAALLLRIVAGLDFTHAAQVLGVSEPTYRFALQRALQQLGDAGVSYAVLGALRERLHRQVKTLPAERVEALAGLRARVLQDAPEPAPAAPPATAPWRRRLAWIGLALLAGAFAATFWPARAPLAPGGVQDLPVEPEPAPMPAGSDADLVTHPDFAQAAAPGDETLAADLALLSWLASGEADEALAAAEALAARAGSATGTTDGVDGAAGPAGEDAARVAAGSAADEAADTPADGTAAAARRTTAPADFPSLPLQERQLLAPLAPAWPALDADTRARLRENAAHWAGLDAPARTALRERLRDWDALAPTEKARRRGPFAAWLALSGAERGQLRGVAGRFAALPPAGQQALREAFEALPSDQRQDWWLGPDVGAGFAELRPLFAFVPEGERAALRDLLRELTPATRADLAILARRLPASEREALRRDLVDAAPADRETLVRERLSR